MPLANRVGGGGGTPQLCEQIDNFTVAVGALTATLTWTAPTTDEDDSFVGTRIVRKVGSAPQSKSDGTVVYEGTALTYTDTGLTDGTTYYYRAFAYNAKNNYQTAMRVVSLTAVNISDTFANNDWDAIIAACQSGSVPSAWSVGDSKDMTIDGVDYQVVIIGKNHDTYADDSGTAPLTFQLLHCLSTTSTWVTNYDTNISIMPSNVQSAIKSVTKKRRATFSNFKLFILSFVEVYGETVADYANVNYTEGTQYAYYLAGNSKKKKVDGSAYSWWTASYDDSGSSTTRYLRIADDGSWGRAGPGNKFGISFGFCF